MLGFIVLGSQTLEDLDNQIYWVWDYVLNEQNLLETPVKSFYFIENVFYYQINDLNSNGMEISNEENDIDCIISKRNFEINKSLDINFLLPDSALKMNELFQNDDKSEISEELSLNSDNLEPRYQMLVNGSDPREESKNDYSSDDRLIQSESHDSYKSSSNLSPKWVQQEKKNFQAKDPKNYSDRNPESSFPDYKGRYNK